jgi:hypothetical protein
VSRTRQEEAAAECPAACRPIPGSPRPEIDPSVTFSLSPIRAEPRPVPADSPPTIFRPQPGEWIFAGRRRYEGAVPSVVHRSCTAVFTELIRSVHRLSRDSSTVAFETPPRCS